MMMELYRQIADCNPNRKTVVLTLLEGEKAGEKALYTDGALQWESQSGGFFSHLEEDLSSLDATGIHTLGGCRVLCEFPAREQKLVICGGGHVSIPVIRMARMIGCSVTVLEDRPKFADNARRAGADRVLCESFEEGLAKIPGTRIPFLSLLPGGTGTIRPAWASSRKSPTPTSA